ncbi:MAG TPA: penicillin acylase family protein [Solirubrobacteraceae bacterium]
MRRTLAATIGWCGLAAVLCAGALAAPSAEIRRTEHGIPHVLADDWEGAGYGYAYAFAQDNLCVMADTYVTVRAQRSRFFGPDAGYESRGTGAKFTNLDSDFFYQRIRDQHTVEKLVERSPPLGPLPEVRAAVKGYVAGYNRYLQEVGVDRLPDPACRGKDWVTPIDELDVWSRFYQLVLLASSGVAVDGIAQAQPPTPPVGLPSSRAPAEMLKTLESRLHGGLGSNAWGLGAGMTDNGRGMVLANPHFPWIGPERFYQAQITIPGQVNVSGASLFGVPAILIGHTDGMAWSHTVSTAFRFTPFELKLVPGSPTTYLYDGEPRQMTVDSVTVKALGADGRLEDRTRKLYSSVHGPVFNSILGLPLFPWTPERAYAMGDANAENFRFVNHFFEVARAQSVGDLDATERRYQGIPWVNTIAADSAGKAYYADIGTIPHVTDELAGRCVNGALGAAAKQLIGLPVLDGSTSTCRWGGDPDAADPGILGPSREPSLVRDDYVANSNDSYWLTNPKQPLEGFPRIIGPERTERSLRTRLSLVMLEGVGSLNADRVQELAFDDRQHAGELWRDELVAMCRSTPGAEEACPVFEKWDLHDDLDSAGAVLFQRFVVHAIQASTSPFREPFSLDDPVHTPRGLDTGNPEVRKALTDAIADLRDAGIPLDAAPRAFQYAERGDERIPLHGGDAYTETGKEIGVFNVIEAPFVAGKGLEPVNFGSSFVGVTRFTGGCPDSRTILTYSQSSDPTSPWYADQTRLFSRKAWVRPPFCEREILADPSLQVTRLGAPRGTPAPAPTVRGRGCLPARLRVTRRRIGPVRLRDTRRRLYARAGAPTSRRAGQARWCVRGGGSVVAVLVRGRVALVATTARGHRLGRVHPGARIRRGRRVRVRGRAVVGVRRGRVRFVGVVARRGARRARALARRV